MRMTLGVNTVVLQESGTSSEVSGCTKCGWNNFLEGWERIRNGG